MEKDNQVTNPDSWRGLVTRMPEIGNLFRDGRKQVRYLRIMALTFEEIEPEKKAFKCSTCHATGEVYWPIEPHFRQCHECGGTGEVTLPFAPGVCGNNIIRERARLWAYAEVGGKTVGKRLEIEFGRLSSGTGGSSGWHEIAPPAD